MPKDGKKWVSKPTEFSEYLRRIRTNHYGFRQIDVADGAGVPRPRLSRWETGARVPTRDNLDKLINYYLSRGLMSYYDRGKLLSFHADAVKEKKLENVKNMCFHV